MSEQMGRGEAPATVEQGTIDTVMAASGEELGLAALLGERPGG